jgi:hypothetical protein
MLVTAYRLPFTKELLVTGKEFPSGLIAEGTKSPVWFESLIFAGQ